MKFLFVLVLSSFLCLLETSLVNGFFFRSKTTDKEDGDRDENENEEQESKTAADISVLSPDELPASAFQPGVWIEFYNDVSLENFRDASFLLRKETLEEQIQRDPDLADLAEALAEGHYPRYRPPPLDVPREPVMSMMLRQVHWMLDEHHPVLFPGVQKEHFAAVITGYVIAPFTGLLKFDSLVSDEVVIRLRGVDCYNKVTRRAQCSLNVQQGQRIPLKALYFNHLGQSGLSLSYEMFGRSMMAVIPASNLIHLADTSTAGGGAAAHGMRSVGEL